MADYGGYMAEMVMVATGSAGFGPAGWIVGGVILLGFGVWAGYQYYQSSRKPKPVNLPSYKTIKLDLDHILS